MVGPAQPMPIGLTGRRTPARLSSSSMISWWIGSASRPHGAGQCGATSRPRPAAARSGAGGRPATPAPRPGADRPRRAARSPRGDRRRASASWHRAPGRAAAGPPVGRGGTVGSNARLELRRHLGDRRRPAPRRSRPGPGRPALDVGGVRPPGRRRRRHAAGRRRHAAGQGRPLPLQLPRVPRVDVRHASRPGSSRSTPTTATPTTSSSTCGTTPTPSPSSSTAPSPTASSGCATACRRSGPGSGCDDGGRAVPGVGDPVRGGRRVGARPDGRAVGAQRRRPLPALHGRHHRHAEGRDVAPGRPDRQPRRRVAGTRSLPEDRRRDALAERLTRPGPVPCRPPADARHRRVQRDVRTCAWPARSSRSPAATSTSSSCSTPSSASG